jgi:hypothetical protein
MIAERKIEKRANGYWWGRHPYADAWYSLKTRDEDKARFWYDEYWDKIERIKREMLKDDVR